MRFSVKFSLGIATLFAHTALAAPANFGIPELQKTIDDNNVTSIEALLPLLPQDLRANFTLVHKSRSIQDASPENPRALLFGSTAKLVLSFNGDPTQRGHQAIEMLSFDDITKKFELRELKFDGSSRPVLSEANPHRCTLCHDSTPRPLWQEYRNWQGAFGADDDFLGYTNEAIAKMGVVGQTEDPRYTTAMKFRAKAVNHPRYKWLGWKKDDVCFPYHCKEDNFDKSLANSPNTRLTQLLGTNQAQAIAARASQSPNFKDFKYTLAWGLMCPMPLVDPNPKLRPEYIIDRIAPTASIPVHERWIGSFAEWIKDVKAHRAFLNLFGVAYGSTSMALRLDNPGDLDLRKHSGARIQSTEADDATGPQPVRGAFVKVPVGDSSAHLTGVQLVRILAKDDAYLNEAMTKSTSWNYYKSGFENTSLYDVDQGFQDYITSTQSLTTMRTEICAHLEKNVLKEVAKKPAAIGGKLTKENRPKNWTPGWEILAKSKCISCHETPGLEFAPKIPFGDPKAFANYVTEQQKFRDPFVLIDAYLDKTQVHDEDLSYWDAFSAMPYVGAALSPKERKTLLEYLKWVSKSYK